MHPAEEATILAFILPARRKRWLEKVASTKTRAQFLDRLNHCSDIDERYAIPLPGGADPIAELRARGETSGCHVLSDLATIDGRTLTLEEAISTSETAGWGTLISCLPGKLAYYYDECSARRLILERSPGE